MILMKKNQKRNNIIVGFVAVLLLSIFILYSQGFIGSVAVNSFNSDRFELQLDSKDCRQLRMPLFEILSYYPESVIPNTRAMKPEYLQYLEDYNYCSNSGAIGTPRVQYDVLFCDITDMNGLRSHDCTESTVFLKIDPIFDESISDSTEEVIIDEVVDSISDLDLTDAEIKIVLQDRTDLTDKQIDVILGQEADINNLVYVMATIVVVSIIGIIIWIYRKG